MPLNRIPRSGWRALVLSAAALLASASPLTGAADEPEAQPPVTQAAVLLSWTPPAADVDDAPLGGLAGYRIYHGTAGGELVLHVDLPNPGLDSYVFEGLAPGAHYFAVTAYSSEGESALSVLGSKTIP